MKEKPRITMTNQIIWHKVYIIKKWTKIKPLNHDYNELKATWRGIQLNMEMILQGWHSKTWLRCKRHLIIRLEILNLNLIIIDIKVLGLLIHYQLWRWRLRKWNGKINRQNLKLNLVWLIILLKSFSINIKQFRPQTQ